MRPPSYYATLTGANSASNRNSSRDLRSSFSSTPTSAYGSRTHLPFVSQSMLVAHCITGVVSSTKPYGQNNHVPASYSSSYSRPSSTKRHTISSNPYLSSSTSSAYSFSYLSPSRVSSRSILSGSSGSSSTSSYRPTQTTSSSAYYKPIRLRDRPILTQISRQINTRPTPTTISRSSQLHSGRSDQQLERTREREKENESTLGQTNVPDCSGEKEENWSSDVARNISRNKYLIKFREKDRRPTTEEAAEVSSTDSTGVQEQVHSSADKARADTQENLPQPSERLDTVEQASEKVDEKKTDSQSLETSEMRVKQADEIENRPVDAEKIARAKPVDVGGELKEKQAVCDIEKIDSVEEKPKRLKEKRNIKLKIKNLTGNSSDPNATTTITTAATAATKTNGKKVANKQSPEVQADGSPVKNKVKRLVKSSPKKATVIDSGTKVSESLASPTSDEKQAKVTSKQKVVKEVDEKQAEKQIPVVESKGDSSNTTSDESTVDKRIRFREYNYDDFNFLSVLGHGGWGFVMLAELKEHDACFAVKCIKKITIVEDDDLDSIMIERKVLTLGNVHPFICKLFCTFETDGYLFFAMEYCAGGDLMFHVQREGKFDEQRCRFYAAEIICAIRFLHNRHIIYRDLKLDNILLDAKGHVRLVDFGMCQCRSYREEMLPSNFCGTPEYISPEIIKGVPYNHSVDWWSFGVLLYEMAVGKMPFRGSDENELLWNVCYEQIHYPMFLSKDLTNLLQSLLEREPVKRMGMSTCKLGDIHDQPWFRTVDWKAVEELRVIPPFVPQVGSKRDVQNFDADFTQSTPQLSPVDEQTLTKIDQNLFQKFPYTNPNIFIFD